MTAAFLQAGHFPRTKWLPMEICPKSFSELREVESMLGHITPGVNTTALAM